MLLAGGWELNKEEVERHLLTKRKINFKFKTKTFLIIFLKTLEQLKKYFHIVFRIVGLAEKTFAH